MNEKEFEFILRTSESFFVEFKERFDKSLAKEIVAFSNSQGNRIFIGVTDSGEIKGIKVTNKLKSQIFDIARNCEPPIEIKLSTYKNRILVVEVPEGDKKPYLCSQGFFVRNGPNSQKLSRVVFNPGGLVKWLKPEEFSTIIKTRKTGRYCDLY